MKWFPSNIVGRMSNQSGARGQYIRFEQIRYFRSLFSLPSGVSALFFVARHAATLQWLTIHTIPPYDGAHFLSPFSFRSGYDMYIYRGDGICISYIDTQGRSVANLRCFGPHTRIPRVSHLKEVSFFGANVRFVASV